MNIYEKPEFKIEEIELEDIIATSTNEAFGGDEAGDTTIGNWW